MPKQPSSKSQKYSITELKKLLMHGEADKTKLLALSYGCEIEIFRCSEDGKRYVASNLLLKLLAELPQKEVLSTIIQYIENPSEIPEETKEDIANFKRFNNLSISDISVTFGVKNWCKNRLLLVPGLKLLSNNSEAENITSVLCGSWDVKSDSMTEEDVMAWVLSSPWAFFLAQIVFLKEVWEAERRNSTFYLELDTKDTRRFDTPPRINVVADLNNNPLVTCGSLGELILRTLRTLGINLFPHSLKAEELDTKLKGLITLLIKYKVWNFYRNRYEIHQSFSNCCYSAIGMQAFNQAGIVLSRAIRDTLISWANENLKRNFSSYKYF